MRSASSDSAWRALQKRIRAVLKTAKSDKRFEIIKAWDEYLKQKLQFPFEVAVISFYQIGPLRGGDKLKALPVELADDHYGVIVACRKVRRRYDHPLAGLEVVDETSTNAQLVADYHMRFANY